MKPKLSNLWLASALCICTFFAVNTSTLHAQGNAPEVLSLLGRYDSGLGEEATEIVSYNSQDKLAFIVNAISNSVDIIDMSNPKKPKLKKRVDLTKEGGENKSIYGGPNSVTVVKKSNYFAVAIENISKQANGWVVFFNNDGKFLKEIAVGALPDMVKSTPDSRFILVANEGEPSKDYANDPVGSITVIDLKNGLNSAIVTQLSFENIQANDFIRTSANPGKSSIAQDLEPEYIAISEDSSKAFVCLQENSALAIIDLTLETPKLIGITALGAKDMSEGMYDLSDKDNKYEPHSLKNMRGRYYSFFMPDSIYSFTIDGKIYVACANEGDSRDYDGYSEEKRLSDIKLDKATFPDAKEIQAKTAMGRLKITTADGDIDDDGDYDIIYGYGGRSFSILDSLGNMIWDSNDDISRRIAEFAVDKRSDDKGAEPEAITVGRVGDKTYAFIGLERAGGVLVYDISKIGTLTDYDNDNDIEPQFIQYINNPEDIAPEGMEFIPAAESPTNTALLLVANEVSGTLAIFSVN